MSLTPTKTAGVNHNKLTAPVATISKGTLTAATESTVYDGSCLLFGVHIDRGAEADVVTITQIGGTVLTYTLISGNEFINFPAPIYCPDGFSIVDSATPAKFIAFYQPI